MPRRFLASHRVVLVLTITPIACVSIDPPAGSAGTGGVADDDGAMGDDAAASDGSGGDASSDGAGVDGSDDSGTGAHDSSGDEASDGESSGGGTIDTTPFFRSDCSLENCGFPQFWGQYEGVLYDTTYVAGGCPDGTDAARIEYRAGPFEPGIEQHPIGFGLQGIGTEPVQGMELYVRWRARVTNQFPGGVNNLGWGGKFIMIADPAPENSRLIANLRDNGDTAESTAYDWSRNIDGPEHGTGLHEVPVGEWVAGQLWVRTSSTADAEDGQLKMWLNGDNASEDTPTGVSPATVAIDVSYWAGNNTRFGGFVALDSPIWSPPPVIELCAFELDDEFDPDWHEP
jgi:hypothetical protein